MLRPGKVLLARPPLVVAAILLSLASVAQANRYKVVALGEPREVTAMNSHGGISGSYGGALIYRGGRWHRLEMDEGSSASYAFDINELNEVAGFEQFADLDVLPVVWGPGKKKTILSLPEGGYRGWATAISDTNLVAGYFLAPESTQTCFLWTPGVGMVTFDFAKKGQYCSAADVNVYGQVVGVVAIPDDHTSYAFIWKDGHMRKLGTLGGKSATATAVNASGVVVGYSFVETNSYEEHAFRWKDGVMTDIGIPTEDWSIYNEAFDINAVGDIVGYAIKRSDGLDYATRFDDGRIIDLNTEVEDLGDWHLRRAWGVSPKGHVIGHGTRGDGLYHSFLLLKQK
jgi:probable HAF family extracellular repeat protein